MIKSSEREPRAIIRSTTLQSPASLAVAVLLAFAMVEQAHAQKYPDHPVRVIVPFAAGGVADITVRVVTERLGDRLGQRFVIENQAGAGGIAAARTVKS